MGKYTSSDGWLLLSIIHCSRRGATLRDIIATGDMLNHTKFEYHELNSGLNKLFTNGYVELDARGRYKATIKATRLYQEVSKHNEGHIAELFRFVEAFQSEKCIASNQDMSQITEIEYMIHSVFSKTFSSVFTTASHETCTSS